MVRARWVLPLLLALLWSAILCAEKPKKKWTPQQRLRGIIHRLTQSETRPLVRLKLVEKLKDYPESRQAESLLRDIYKLDPDKKIQKTAKKISHEHQSSRYFSNIPIIEFQHPEIVPKTLKKPRNPDEEEREEAFSLTKRELTVGVAAFHGNIQRYLKSYIMNRLLDLEIKRWGGTIYKGSVYEGSEFIRLATQKAIDKIVENKYEEFLETFTKKPALKTQKMDFLIKRSGYSNVLVDYYGPSQLTNYLWSEWLTEVKIDIRDRLQAMARAEILNYLIHRRASLNGMSRDYFTPSDVRGFYKNSLWTYRTYVQQKPIGERTSTELEKFKEKNPQMKLLVVFPKARLQGVWFRIPSIRELEKKYPKHAQRARLRRKKIFDRVLSDATREWSRQLLLAIFNRPVTEGTSKESKRARSYAEFLKQQIERETVWLSKRISGSKGIKPSFQEIVLEGHRFVFKTSRAILGKKRSEAYPFVIALRNAVQVSIGRYLVRVRNKISPNEVFLLTSSLRFILRRLDRKIKDAAFDYLEAKKAQFTTIYKKLTAEEKDPQKKANVFKTIAEEFGKSAPLEIFFMKPDWMEQGDRALLPQMERYSFGKKRMKLGKVLAYYSTRSPQASIALFQWTGFREARFLKFKDSRNGIWVGKVIQGFLAQRGMKRAQPMTERELYQRYRRYLTYYGVPGARINIDTFFQKDH